jgi:amidophosphoribosyltransferase
MGRQLAAETKITADIVVPVPDSGIPAAQGFSEATGIPLSLSLIKNRYIGRTFIQPEQHLREWMVRMKLNPIRSAIAGKRVVMVDDSIVRGTTSPQVIQMLRDAGATEIHFLVSSPPYRFYGIDTPAQEQLIAFAKTSEEIRQFLGVDSLHYLSYEGLISATGLPESMLCTSCFTGEYPVSIEDRMNEIRCTPKER